MNHKIYLLFDVQFCEGHYCKTWQIIVLIIDIVFILANINPTRGDKIFHQIKYLHRCRCDIVCDMGTRRKSLS